MKRQKAYFQKMTALFLCMALLFCALPAAALEGEEGLTPAELPAEAEGSAGMPAEETPEVPELSEAPQETAESLEESTEAPEEPEEQPEENFAASLLLEEEIRHFASFQEALEAAAGLSEARLRLDADLEIETPLVLGGEAASLDLNGYAIRFKGEAGLYAIHAKGKLTILDESEEKTGLVENLSGGVLFGDESLEDLQILGGSFQGRTGIHLENAGRFCMENARAFAEEFSAVSLVGVGSAEFGEGLSLVGGSDPLFGTAIYTHKSNVERLEAGDYLGGAKKILQGVSLEKEPVTLAGSLSLAPAYGMLLARTELLSENEGLVYSWYRDGEAISGAEKNFYPLSEEDVGHSLHFRVSAGLEALESPVYEVKEEDLPKKADTAAPVTIGGGEFLNLEEAVTAANLGGNCTILLHADVQELPNTLVVTADAVSLDLNGYRILSDKTVLDIRGDGFVLLDSAGGGALLRLEGAGMSPTEGAAILSRKAFRAENAAFGALNGFGLVLLAEAADARLEKCLLEGGLLSLAEVELEIRNSGIFAKDTAVYAYRPSRVKIAEESRITAKLAVCAEEGSRVELFGGSYYVGEGSLSAAFMGESPILAPEYSLLSLETDPGFIHVSLPVEETPEEETLIPEETEEDAEASPAEQEDGEAAESEATEEAEERPAEEKTEEPPAAEVPAQSPVPAHVARVESPSEHFYFDSLEEAFTYAKEKAETGLALRVVLASESRLPTELSMDRPFAFSLGEGLLISETPLLPTLFDDPYVKEARTEDGLYAYSAYRGAESFDGLGFYGTALKPREDLGIHYFVDAAYGEKLGGVCFWKNEESFLRPVSTAKQEEIGEQDCLLFSYSGIAAKEMTETLHCALYFMDGESRVYIQKTAKRTSLMEEASELLLSTEEESLIRLLVDMLHYGSTVQEFKNYRIEDRPDERLAALLLKNEKYASDYIRTERFDFASLSRGETVQESGNEELDAMFRSSSLGLGNTLSVNLYLTVGEKYRAEDLRLLVWTEEVDSYRYSNHALQLALQAVSGKAGSDYAAVLGGLPASALGMPLYIALYDLETDSMSAVKQVSLLGYAAPYAGTVSEEVVNALMHYAESAENYGR